MKEFTVLITAFVFGAGQYAMQMWVKPDQLAKLWLASGSGAVTRRVMGTTVIGGMLAASFLAIFLIPVTFYVVEKYLPVAKAKSLCHPRSNRMEVLLMSEPPEFLVP